MSNPVPHTSPRLRRAACCLVATLPLVLGACALRDSLFPRSGGDETTSEAASDETTPRVYYTKSAGVPLYREPGSDLVTRLPLHQKVLRYRLERGYAYVHVDGTGETGWLDNAKLIWRLPRQRTAAPAESPAATTDDAAAAPASDAAAAAPADDGVPATSGGTESETVAAPSPAPPAAPPADSAPAVSPSVFEPF